LEKEKEAVKKEMERIIQTKQINTPRELAECYLKYKTNKTSELPVIMSISTALEKFYDIFSALPVTKANDDLNRELEEIKISLIDTPLKQGFKKFSKQTANLLKTNYSPSVIKIILQALADFSIAIDFSMKKPKGNRNCLALSSKQLYTKQAKACDDLLLFSFLTLTETEKNTIETIKKRTEGYLKEIKKVSIDPVKEFELQMSSSMGLLSPYDPVEWSKAFRIVLHSNLIVKKQKGRPKDIFFKALQIVIYKYLVLDRPRNVSRYKEWAKKLTASIINEFYKDKGLPNLTTKDIDNALHSS
jgi:hypothetical protein